MNQRLKNLHVAFEPRSIAFVGATETKGKWGFIIFNNLINGGYKGKLFPVNPTRDKVLGFKAYPSVKDIPDSVDLALFTVPAKFVPSAIEDCVAKGVQAGVVISAGFKELGAQGALLEQKMVETAKAGGMILIGPNGQGVCNPQQNLFGWMPMDYHPPGGKIAIVSQSGNIQLMFTVGIAQAGFGVSKSASSGNEADIRIDDYIEYFAGDEDTQVSLCYAEGITYGREFAERARKASRQKPIVLVKGGATSSGVAAASSHTGALAVSSNLFDSVCRQTGIIQSDRLEEAAMIAASFINRPLPKGKRVGIVTGGGGLGVIAADWCTKLGLDVPRLSSQTLSTLTDVMPGWWVPGNPVDLVAGLQENVLVTIVDILMRSGEVDSLLFLLMGPPPKEEALKTGPSESHSWDWNEMVKRATLFVEFTHDMAYQYEIPCFMVSTMLKDQIPRVHDELGDKFYSLQPTIETACICIKAQTDYSLFLASEQREE